MSTIMAEKELNENEIDIMAVDEEGNTILMTSALNDNVGLSLMLAENKDLINMQNNKGETALHIAVKEDNFEIAYALIEMGANLDLADNEGETGRSLIENGWNEELQRRIANKRGDSIKDIIKIIQHVSFRCDSSDEGRFSFVLYLINKVIREIDEDDDDEIKYLFDILDAASTEEFYVKILDTVYKAGFDFTKTYVFSYHITSIRDYSLKPHKGISAVEKMLELCVDLDSAYIKGATPANIVAGIPEFPDLFWEKDAVDYGNVAKYFSVESMEELNQDGKSALHLAARFNHEVMLKTMLEKGANVNVTEDSPATIGATPLHEACTRVNVEAVRVLKAAGADDSLVTESGETPAHYIARKVDSFSGINDEKRVEIMELLDNVDEQRNDGRTPLMLAQFLDYNSAIQLTLTLVDKGVDVNKADNSGNTALLLHIDNHICDKEAVKALVKAGADVNAKNKFGDTPLHMAIKEGKEMVARFLIKKGADYQAANDKGDTPVDMAVAKGMEMVLELIQNIEG